mgnify:CR=1 FL=1
MRRNRLGLAPEVTVDWHNFQLVELYDEFCYKQESQILERDHYRDSPFMLIVRRVSSVSALLFFGLAHLILMRFHPLFSLLTSIVPMFLDKKVKESIYQELSILLSFLYYDPIVQRTPMVQEVSHEIDKKHIQTLKDE